MKKILLTFILALAVGIMAKAETSGNWTDYKAASFSEKNDGNKTITIHSAAELALLAYSIFTNGLYKDYTITLATDLDLSGHYWIPIGTYWDDSSFQGTFNGGGHTISNLDVWVKEAKDTDEPVAGIDVTPNGNVAGLFGKIGSTGIVKDVIIGSGAYIGVRNPTATCSMGGIAGINEGNVVGCVNTLRVTSSYDYAEVGGIVGYNNGTVQNCYCLGEVYSSQTNNKIGGIVGNNGTSGKVQNCFYRGTITISGTESPYPIVGNNASTSPIAGCFYANGATTNTTVPIAVANASDNSSTLSGYDKTVKNVLLQDRTLFTDGDWNTICLPFSITAGDVAGYSPIAGATVMTLESTSFSSGTLTLNFVNATSIVAGKPYVVKWNNTTIGNLANPVFMNATVSNTTTNITTTYADFIGCFSPVSLSQNDNTKLYLGSANKLYYPAKADKAINACRAYFGLKGIAAGTSGARSFVMNFGDEETTGIVNLTPALSKGEGVVYNLRGQRVATPANGLYIVNGKKVFIK